MKKNNKKIKKIIYFTFLFIYIIGLMDGMLYVMDMPYVISNKYKTVMGYTIEGSYSKKNKSVLRNIVIMDRQRNEKIKIRVATKDIIEINEYFVVKYYPNTRLGNIIKRNN